MNQNTPVQNTPEQTAPIQSSSNAVWYIVGTVLLVVALALWYVYSTQAPSINVEIPTATTQVSPISETQTSASTNGNTTADISADLTQTLNDSVTLDQDAAASVQAINGL